MSLIEVVLEIGGKMVLEVFKGKYNLDEIRCKMRNYLDRQEAYHYFSSLEGEFDFQGLREFIEGEFPIKADSAIFSIDSLERKQAKDRLIQEAIYSSKAKTPEAQQTVSKCIADIIDIIHNFCKEHGYKKDERLAGEIVDAVGRNVKLEMQKQTEVITRQIDNLGKGFANKSLVSSDVALGLAKKGDFEEIEKRIRTVMWATSQEHPLNPYYGYDYTDGQIVSKPLTVEAAALYPNRMEIKGEVFLKNKAPLKPGVNPFQYSYQHQIPISIKVFEARKLLGDTLDPVQKKAESLIGKTIVAIPPEFPPAIPCSIKINGETFYDYILIRLQEILEDGRYVIGNQGQNIPFSIEIVLDLNSPSVSGFKIDLQDTDNKEVLAYLRFINAMLKGKNIEIIALDRGEVFFSGQLNSINLNTIENESIGDRIAFLERICDVENYFSVKFEIKEDADEKDYECAFYLSELVRGKTVKGTWENLDMQVEMHSSLNKTIRKFGESVNLLACVFNATIELFGVVINFQLKREYYGACIKDYKKILNKLECLDLGDIFSIQFVSCEENTYLDTLITNTGSLSDEE